jgi:hypothetical protein
MQSALFEKLVHDTLLGDVEPEGQLVLSCHRAAEPQLAFVCQADDDDLAIPFEIFAASEVNCAVKVPGGT